MRRRRVLWQLYPSYLLIMLVSLIAVAWYSTLSLKEYYFDETADALQIRATLIADRLQFSFDDPTTLSSLASTLGSKAAVRVTVVSPSGKVLADTEEEPAQMPNQSTRTEIAAARSGHVKPNIWFNTSIDQQVMGVAVPVKREGTTLGYIRTSMPIGFIDQSLKTIRFRIAAGALVIGLLSALVSFWVSRRISQPLQQLRAGAERYARGDFSTRVPTTQSEEISGLADAMNEMAEQLDDRINTVTRQRNEQEAILTSMIEGVIAVDIDERLIIINQAAARFMHVIPEQARGRTIQEVIRNTDMLRLISQTLTSQQPVEGDIVLIDRDEQYLQAHGTLLKDSDGRSIGALLVFHDITQLRKLERMRREFVANVSHELKTPITSIKGFVETLQDGAVENPEDAQRFLGIVHRHVDRLNQIIEDLLSLSRIEQDAEKNDIPLNVGPLCEVIQAATQTCSLKAQEKGLQINVCCDSGLQVRMNPALLEQAIVNLIDNAIKYSETSDSVDVSASQSGSDTLITVTDRGRGIATEHLPRLFERFYRVDKARSRTLGGTGLGLAIVKHIVLAHGGRVSVESVVSQGSTFRIHLPTISR